MLACGRYTPSCRPRDPNCFEKSRDPAASGGLPTIRTLSRYKAFFRSPANVWVGNGICLFHSQDCTNAGLSQFDGQSWINHRVTYAHNNNSGDLVYEIAVDEAGIVWVGMASGVMRFDVQGWITYTQADGLAPDTRYGGTVYALAIDPMGRKWLGTQTALTPFDDTPDAEMAPLPPHPRVETGGCSPRNG